MKKGLALALCALLALTGAGCLKGTEIDKLGYVMALGLDRGKELPYSVTMLILDTNTEADDQQSGGFNAVRAESHGLYEAICTLEGSLPYRLDLSRVMMLVLSAEVAAEEGEAETLLRVPLTDLHIRYNANVFISLGDAYDALSGLENEIMPNLSKIMTNFVTYAQTTGHTPVANLMQMREAIQSKAFDAAAPLCGTAKGEDATRKLPVPSIVEEGGYLGGQLQTEGGMDTSAAGAAVFSGARLACVLDGQHTQALLMAQGEFREGWMRFTMDGENVSLMLKRAGEPEVRLWLTPTVRAEVVVPLTAILESGPQDAAEKVFDAAAALLTERADRTFRVCRAVGADAFGFGKRAIKQFRTEAAWTAYDWAGAYAGMEAGFVFTVRADGGRVQ